MHLVAGEKGRVGQDGFVPVGQSLDHSTVAVGERGGHRKEDAFWRKTLTALAVRLGDPAPDVSEHVACVDARRQWARWRTVWYNAAVRSAGQTIAGPFARSMRRVPAR